MAVKAIAVYRNLATAPRLTWGLTEAHSPPIGLEIVFLTEIEVGQLFELQRATQDTQFASPTTVQHTITALDVNTDTVHLDGEDNWDDWDDGDYDVRARVDGGTWSNRVSGTIALP